MRINDLLFKKFMVQKHNHGIKEKDVGKLSMIDSKSDNIIPDV